MLNLIHKSSDIPSILCGRASSERRGRGRGPSWAGWEQPGTEYPDDRISAGYSADGGMSPGWNQFLSLFPYWLHIDTDWGHAQLSLSLVSSKWGNRNRHYWTDLVPSGKHSTVRISGFPHRSREYCANVRVIFQGNGWLPSYIIPTTVDRIRH